MNALRYMLKGRGRVTIAMTLKLFVNSPINSIDYTEVCKIAMVQLG